MRKLFKWLDDNILSILAGFLLIFIPLYPKLPLFDVLPGYIVRVRMEDILVSVTILIWLLQLMRKKVKLFDNPLIRPIAAYLLIGILSVISAIFIIQTIPKESIFIFKILLHYLRRIEYFSLFFIFYSTIRNVRQLKIYLSVFLLTILGVVIYGFGQKYLYWPAFSTMNREFSKGWMLYLTQHARVLSTFGGHYDLAAFIMMALVLLWSLFFSVRKIVLKIGLFLLIAGSFWTLILTASRTSFLAYLGGTSVLFCLFMFRKGIKWALKRWTFVTIFSIVIMLSFGDLSERFTKLLRIDERISNFKTLLLSPLGAPPSNRALFLENNPEAALAEITSKTDQPPTPLRPSDVYLDIPLLIPNASDSSTVSKSRTYSQNAFMYDLSTAIRLDALWPQAIRGFKKNPLLGSGYSTLNKTQLNQFTEAESTDNDYLRSLGETGILGFVTFFGIFAIMIYTIYQALPIIRDPIVFGASVGLMGFLFGLLVNAVYIDVFESSKVAYVFWSLSGIVLATVELIKRERKGAKIIHNIPDLKEFQNSFSKKFKWFITGDLFVILIILSIAFGLRLYKIDSPIADWHSWRQADTSSVTRNYVKYGINLLFPTYHDLSNVASGKDNPKGLRFVEFPLYNFFSVVADKIFVGYTIEISGRLASIFSSLGAIIFLYLLVRKYLGRFTASLSALFYAILPYNIYYTRVILPEPLLVFASCGMIYFVDKWLDKSSLFKLQSTTLSTKIKSLFVLFLAIIFTSASVLVKPYALFLFLPLVYLWYKRFGVSLKSVFSFIVFISICLLPFVWWRWWIGQYPEGVPANTWLLNGDGIRFKGAFFYWLFAERFAKLILGYYGVTLVIFGILSMTKKGMGVFVWWAIGILLYITVVATGNIRHDYYQTLTIPIITILLARGIKFIIDVGSKEYSRLLTIVLVIILVIFMEMFGWYQVRDLYNINHPEIVEAGGMVEKLTHEKALVIAPYDGDTAFLYQTHRAGWPVLQDPIDKMIKRGAQYYVSVKFDDTTKQLIRDASIKDPEKQIYKIISLTDKFVIIQLVPDVKLPH